MNSKINIPSILILFVHFISIFTEEVAIGSDKGCCDFQANECNWIDMVNQTYPGYTTWAWSKTDEPDSQANSDYFSNEIANEWTQSTSIKKGDSLVAIKHSNKVIITENAPIVLQFYRSHRSSQLTLQTIDDFDRKILLSNYTQTGWNHVEAVCGTTIPCCVNYPCSVLFQITGTLTNKDDLLAFGDIKVNNCNEPTQSPTTQSTTAKLTSPTATPSSDTNLSTGALAGIVIAALLLLLLIIFVGAAIRQRRKRQHLNSLSSSVERDFDIETIYSAKLIHKPGPQSTMPSSSPTSTPSSFGSITP